MCRVLPDVTAIERSFDYAVPDDLAASVRVGAIVRVDLHGRRVRGWVVADDVVADVDDARLRPLRSVSSEGPPPIVVELCSAVAYRTAGATAALLRVASPPNNVTPGSVPSHAGQPPWFERLLPNGSEQPFKPEGGVTVVRRPPSWDRRDLVAGLLAASGSTLVVIADGARAAAFASWLRTRGVRVALLHSDADAAARTAAWRVAAGGGCVVVGGRMAAFAPVPDLACAVLLDDGDEALQEERTPTWHARDVLAARADAAAAPLVIVSPAPTVASLALATGAVDTLPRAMEAAGWPRVEVVDLGEQPPGTGMLTAALLDRMRATADAGDVAVVVLNRRGSVRTARCRTCGTITRWDAHARPAWVPPTDDVAYVKPGFCPACASTKLRVLGVGVQRLARDLGAALGGRVAVDVVDAGTGALTGARTGALTGAPVVVGTEAVLHHTETRRRRPALVAFADLDQELCAPRYRASEQALWLAARAAHLLAARPHAETRLVVQTSMPDHEVVRALRTGDPAVVAGAERARRERYGLPPFGALAEARGDEVALARLAEELGRFDVASTGTVVVHDDTATLLVRAPDPVALAAALSLALPPAREHGAVRIAVDPPRV